MKWKSVLFSALDNKLGDQIVGARWKGRGYFRSYVIPANPKTDKQQAHRDCITELVGQCQAEVLSDPDIKSAWNTEALPLAISGYNLFVKYGRTSKISCPATGTADETQTLTYTCGVPLASAGIFQVKSGVCTEVAAKGTLESGADKTVETGSLSAGTYTFFIADADVLVSGDSWPEIYQGVTKWEPDEDNGVAKEAECVVS